MTTLTQSSPTVAKPQPIVRPGGISTSLTMAYRSMLKIRRAPEQLTDALMLPIIFTLLFTYLFGGALSGSTSDYLQELLPGTLVMTVVLVTTFIGTGLNTDLTRGRLDRFRAMPIWQPSLIVGSLIGDVARYLLTSASVIGLGLLMGFRPDGGVLGVLAGVGLILAFALGLSWIWTTLGLLARSPQSLGILSFLVQFPLLFASNTFVAPDTMPGWLKRFVDVNPVSRLVSTERHLMAGTTSVSEVATVLLSAAAIALVFFPLTMWLYRRRT